MSASALTASSSDETTPPRGRLRAWRFTQHAAHVGLPSDRDLTLPSALPAGARYLIAQMEICPSTGRRHIQGVIYMNSLKSFAQMRALLPSDLRRCDNLKGAIAYCEKVDTREPGSVPVEMGVRPAQGKRTELPEFVELVRQGTPKRQLVDTHPSVIARYRNFYDDVRALFPPSRGELRTCLLVGPTGTGKSHYAREMCGEDAYYVVPKSKNCWFDGYDGEEFVIFDDFKGHVALDKLLEMLDPWSVRMEVKGSFVWLSGKNLIFTSNFHPRDWYDYDSRDEHRRALYRRINAVFEFSAYREYTMHDTQWSPDCDTSNIPYLGY